MIFWQSSFRTLSRGFVSFHDACMLRFASVGLATGFHALVVLDLMKRSCFHMHFQLSRAFFMVALNTISSGSIKNAPQLSRIVERRFLDSPLLLFFSLRPNLWPHFFRSGSCSNLCKPPEHKKPLADFAFNVVNFVNAVHESAKLRSTSTFQQSSIRLSCNTSKFVCVVLDTSMHFSGLGNGSSFGTQS